MTHIPPPAEELRLLDAELFRLDARRAQLLHRRAWLVAALQPQAPVRPPRPETTPPRVQNVLLMLGGILLVIAATAFTLVSWGELGIGGRALVLGGVTAATLAAPVALLRRGLRSTAEAVAGLGLALTALDAIALYSLAFPDAEADTYTAVATALLAALWAGYGLLPRVSELRLPRPAALSMAQFPLFFAAWALGADVYGVTAAVLVTAAFDTVVALGASARPVRLLAAVGAYGLGGPGAWTAGVLAWTASGPGAAARAAALLLFAAALALAAAWRLGGRHAVGLATAAGLLTVAALGAVPLSALPGMWAAPVHLAFGIALLAALRPVLRLPEQVRRGFAVASAAVQALALVGALPVVAVTLLGPVAWTWHAWSGAPANAREAVTADAPWPPDAATVPLVLVAVAAVLAVAVRRAKWRPRALTGALTLAWAAALTLPAVLELPFTTGLLALGALTAVTLASPYGQPASTVLALVTSAVLAFTALASQSATLTALGALTVFFAAVSWRLTPVTAPASLVSATALACATGAAAGWEPERTALLVLAVPVAAALVTARVNVPAVELTGAAAGLLAVGLAAGDLRVLALVLAVCAVITAGVAVRADRRPVGHASAALFVLAAWAYLAAWDVTAPEAYTVPVSVPALVVGHLRRRRDPGASSWTAYGFGLAATLVPSLCAAWGDPHWTRPLLLGLAALSVTLLGAGHNLQAPLLLGGAVLSLDALHELAPYIVQVTDALPRWVLPALAGLLLLALGATYEQRIRDVRRVRETLGKMN
ncbi:SCO7613 C-terminal domain-containing membrane protein [Streptomyces sp. NPDC090106]|uniref:SCO7613 C-terminal domain-containing membrane protein n=1 Tax=Streptomyces sp. NPDC090106 TaxID=3365946 RepID=UPI00380ABE2A